MGPQTRSRGAAPPNRTYTSSTPQQQVHFKPRRKLITYRRSLGSTRLSRQQTLTQIDFVNLQSTLGDQEDLPNTFEDEENKRKAKRRRTVGDAPTSSAKSYTQTLTQLDFVSTPAVKDEELDDALSESGQKHGDEIETNVGDENDHYDGFQMIPESPVTGESQLTDNTLLSLRTPSKQRIIEIPSSQSPATPLSTQSRDSPDKRSPLRERSINIKLQRSPMKGSKLNIRSPIVKLEIKDSMDSEDTDSIEPRVPSTPAKRFSPQKLVRFASIARSPTTSQATPIVKYVIEDSDADMDDEPDTCYDEFGPETQAEAVNLVSSSEKDTRNSSPLDEENEDHEISQFRASQRLSTQDFDGMGPRSDRSDIIISIHPKHVQNIVSGAKNHEFRAWPIPDQVTRIWIYETSPVSALKYMAMISSAKRPGEITDLEGIGNKEFNAGEGTSSYAYEILQLYELADPVSLAAAKARNWLGGPPQKFIYVRPAVLDALMANLKPPAQSSSADIQNASTISQTLTPKSANGHPNASFTSSDSQQADAQLFSTMLQFTQPSSSLIGSSDTKFNEALDLLSTQQDSYREPQGLPRPSQATTVDMSQSPRLLRATARRQQQVHVIADSDEDDDEQFDAMTVSEADANEDIEVGEPVEEELFSGERQDTITIIPPSSSTSALLAPSQPPPPTSSMSSSPPLLPPPPVPTSSPDETANTQRQDVGLDATPERRNHREEEDEEGDRDQLSSMKTPALPFSLSSSQLLLTKSQMLPADLMDDETVPVPPLLTDDEIEDE